MIYYFLGTAIPALGVAKGASDRVGSKAIGGLIGVAFYAAMIGGLYALGKFDV